MAHDPLITRAQLPRYGVPADFLAQFDVRAIQVTVSTAGSLGTMAVKWRTMGGALSVAVVSSSAAPWTWSPPGAYAAITFAAASYVTTATYTIDEAGAVTRSGTGPDTVTAERWDVVGNVIASVTDRATSAMQPRYTLPLVSWGDGVKKAAADWIKYELKSDVGMSAGDNSVGDVNVRLRYEDALAYFRRLGAGPDKSPEIVDSSTGGAGRGLMVGIASGDRAGWDDSLE